MREPLGEGQALGAGKPLHFLPEKRWDSREQAAKVAEGFVLGNCCNSSEPLTSWPGGLAGPPEPSVSVQEGFKHFALAFLLFKKVLICRESHSHLFTLL